MSSSLNYHDAQREVFNDRRFIWHDYRQYRKMVISMCLLRRLLHLAVYPITSLHPKLFPHASIHEQDLPQHKHVRRPRRHDERKRPVPFQDPLPFPLVLHCARPRSMHFSVLRAL